MLVRWPDKALGFFSHLNDAELGGSASVPGGAVTLYGTCYAALARAYIDGDKSLTDRTREFLAKYQDSKTGLMIGPELAQHFPGIDAAHDREHLIFHLTCTVLAACQHFHVPVRYSVVNAHRFCDRNYLAQWLSERDLKRAWLEGNNILFVGQLLVYLRDYERHPGAQAALEFWFSWLDNNVDRRTGLWGTDGFCTPAEAVYGGYHQLLVYFHEEHRIPNARGLVDTILALQHIDGSFSPSGNGGACEDVDCVDILVNIYKRNDYRRAQIRYALT